MSKPLMELYQAEWCPYCERVRMKLTELGIPYITVNVPREKSMRNELFNISGQRGIPTLVDGDVIIADDDDAIIAYLEGRFGRITAAIGKPD
jgi:glutaredoxin 3